MAGHNTASNTHYASIAAETQYFGTPGYQGLGREVPSDAPCDVERETLTGNIKHALKQAERVDRMASQIEAALFGSAPNKACESDNKSLLILTVDQNVSTILSRLYSAAGTLEDLLSKIGGR